MADDPELGIRIPGPRFPEREHCYAVLLYLDDVADQRVCRIWDALDEHGTRPVRAAHGPEYRPHITLAIVETARPEYVEQALQPLLPRVRGLAVDLTAVGFFVNDQAPAFLAVSPTVGLVTLHHDVHLALDALGPVAHDSWDYYRPGTWLPHCTLAMDADTPGTITSAVGSVADLPIRATVSYCRLEPLPDLLRTLRVYDGPPLHRAGPQHKAPRRRFLIGAGQGGR
ncbi:MAG TPA: 2'-5' RNA ligase family protein [Intrasporangium sp.]|nr:2'-5' RNA ligase family protein [Intrasporangium sp.]